VSRRMWKDKIKMNLKKHIWCEDMDWIHLAQDSVKWLVLVNTVMNIWVP